MKKIDMHIHVGLDPFVVQEGYDVIKKEITIPLLLKQMDRNEIIKSVILALDIPNHKVEDEYVLELSKKFPKRFIPCACINPLKHKDFGVGWVRQLKNFKLIKLMPPYQFFFIDDERLYTFYKECEKQKKILIFHTGTTDFSFAKLKYSNPIGIDTIAVDFPKLKILMAHSGDPWFKETADILIKNSNVYADISGIILGTDPTRGKKTLINFFNNYLELFPEDKLMYGSDWPYTRLEDYTEVIKNYSFKSNEFMKKLCYKNAEKFLGF